MSIPFEFPDSFDGQRLIHHNPTQMNTPYYITTESEVVISINELLEDGVHFRDMLALLPEVGGVVIHHRDPDTWRVMDTLTGITIGTGFTFEAAFRIAIEHIVGREKVKNE